MKNVIQSEGGVKAMRGAKDPVEVTQNVLDACVFNSALIAAGPSAPSAYAARAV
jgi:hypothetical protein